RRLLVVEGSKAAQARDPVFTPLPLICLRGSCSHRGCGRTNMPPRPVLQVFHQPATRYAQQPGPYAPHKGPSDVVQEEESRAHSSSGTAEGTLLNLEEMHQSKVPRIQKLSESGNGMCGDGECGNGECGDTVPSKVDAVMHQSINPTSLPTLSTIILYNNTVLRTGNFGKRNGSNPSSAPPDEYSVYRIASISKIFPTLMLYQLWENGNMASLDDSLEKYVENFSIKNPLGGGKGRVQISSSGVTLRRMTGQLSEQDAETSRVKHTDTFIPTQHRSPPSGLMSADESLANELNTFFARFEATSSSANANSANANSTNASSASANSASANSASANSANASSTNANGTIGTANGACAEPTIEQRPLIITESDMRRVFKRVNTRKAAGPDGICGRVLKACADQLAPVFTDIFNLSLTLGIVPSSFK
ncbi:hypothetical protein P4O66_006163, partial [Electrophorus voltai]